MARHRITLPGLGDAVEGVVVVEWRVGVGDHVSVDQTLVTVETDKVDTDVPSPLDGVIAEILAEPGAALSVGDPLCVIESP